jgi:anaerobic ribonucleoside-triphosphate reductase
MEPAKSIPTTNQNDLLLKDDERQACEVWTRVMGYHRPVTEFNPGKQSEIHERKYFKESRLGFLEPTAP